MNAQEILSGANRLTFSKFEDINLSLLTKISKEVTKLFGDFEVVSNKQIRGKKELNIKAGGFTYIGKGEF